MGVVPIWLDRLLIALAIYIAGGTAWMLSGAGGTRFIFYVGLYYQDAAEVLCLIVVAATARRMAAGPLRSAWWSLTAALALYLIGDGIETISWTLGRDPFPGPDCFYCAFYLPLAASALWMIRAGAVRVPWTQLSLDATIFVVGFGAFFWFLVIEPAAIHAQLGMGDLSQSFVVSSGISEP